MLRGQFIRGDGAIIPNNITKAGALLLLKGCFQDVTRGFILHLADAAYTPDLAVADLGVPSNLGGYAGKEVTFPTSGFVNNEAYVESAAAVWAPTVAYSKTISRLALLAEPGTIVFGVSQAFAPIVLTPDTAIELRTFRYRVYLR